MNDQVLTLESLQPGLSRADIASHDADVSVLWGRNLPFAMNLSGEIIQYGDLIRTRYQRGNEMRAYESRSPGNQHIPHFRCAPLAVTQMHSARL